jgi:hypothetical protein
MPDREKVLRGLECLITNETPCEGCPYNGSGYCLKNIAKDARELLKEQEPVEAKTMGESKSHGAWWFACGACGHAIDLEDNYCRECGKAVKWND